MRTTSQMKGFCRIAWFKVQEKHVLAPNTVIRPLRTYSAPWFTKRPGSGKCFTSRGKPFIADVSVSLLQVT